MFAPPPNVLSISNIVVRWFPALGVSLAVIGALMVGAGMRDAPSPNVAVRPVVSHNWTHGAMANAVAISASLRDDRPRVWSGDRHAPRARDTTAGGWAGAAGDYLATERARDWHAESTQVAGIPLNRDLRDAFMEMATGRQAGRVHFSCPCLMPRLPSRDEGQIGSDDRIANALFGCSPATMPAGTSQETISRSPATVARSGVGRLTLLHNTESVGSCGGVTREP